ncbi:ABC transporter substrate-binding protein [Paenibacillus hamazuiensis]|uniref:ABC transporter substrate-binding protein n=1 Tax=Paenibacillus hamazuiensis TaxID=2936508 RepID=UPI00200EC8C7|nr:extracellular solute-binding protein [Paenibacillus hamazuiensis]
MASSRKATASALAAFMLASAALAGCTGGSGDGKPGSESGSAGKLGEKEAVIRVWGPHDFMKGDESPGQMMVKAFNEKNKGKIRVEMKYMPWAEYNTAIQAAVTSNDLPDIFNLPQNIDFQQVLSSKWIRPLDGIVSDAWRKQFYNGAFAEGVNVIGGKTYTWPIFGPQLNQLLYYNKDVLKNAGLDPDKPPKTWDELRSMAKTVTEKGKGDVFGVVFALAENGYATNTVTGFAAGINNLESGGFNYKTGTYTYDSKAISDSVKLILDLKKDGSILPSSYNLKHPEAGALFGQGKAAFLFDGRWRMWLIKRDTPDAKYGMAALPTPAGEPMIMHHTLANNGGFMVSASTKYPEAVGKFIEEGLASELFYEGFMKSGVGLSPIEKLNADKSKYPYPEYEVFAKLHKDVLRLRPDPAVRNPEATKVLVEIGGMGQPKIKPSFNELLQAIIMGAEKDPDSALRAYNEKMAKGFKDGLEKVKQSGAKVDASDFSFPNWDPKKDYTDQDYAALKK